MGIFSKIKQLKQLTGFDKNESVVNNDCMVKIKIRKSEFIIMSKFYYRGYTSYRDYYKYVFMRNTKKIIETMNKAQKKAESGCIIDNTLIHFFYDSKHFIELPFEVFSDKKNITISRRNNKLWNRQNIQRILKLYPDYIKHEKTLISESEIYNLINCE